MSTHNRILIAGAAGLLLSALPALAKTPQKAKPKAAPAETAVIENTGSTNTKGYKITVYSGGGARMDGKNLGLPMAMNTKFFQDLAAAMPLSALPARHGMRSASFGTRTFITYKGQQTPDLTFGGDAKAAALKADIDAITRQIGVSNAPRRPVVRPVTPAEPQPEQK